MNTRIRQLRKSLGLNQTEFGQRIGLQQNAISLMEKAGRKVTEKNILTICTQYNVNEEWLRTGEGEMFVQKSPGDEISAFVGDILRGEPDFRQRFITVLARMTPDEWKLLERKVLELADEIKKADPDGSAQQESSDM